MQDQACGKMARVDSDGSTKRREGKRVTRNKAPGLCASGQTDGAARRQWQAAGIWRAEGGGVSMGRWWCWRWRGAMGPAVQLVCFASLREPA